MTAETLGFWRDLALILLIAQAFILALVTGAAIGFSWYYLRKGRKALYLPLLMVQVYALRIQHLTMQVTDKLAAVPIGISAASAQATTMWRTWWNAFRSKDKTHGTRTSV